GRRASRRPAQRSSRNNRDAAGACSAPRARGFRRGSWAWVCAERARETRWTRAIAGPACAVQSVRSAGRTDHRRPSCVNIRRGAVGTPSVSRVSDLPSPFASMRIAIISTPFIRVPPAGYGGTELFCYELAEELHARGHDVTIFTTGDSEVSCKKRWL